MVLERHPAQIGIATRLLPTAIDGQRLVLSIDGSLDNAPDCEEALAVIAAETGRILGRSMQATIAPRSSAAPTGASRSAAYQAAASHDVVQTLISTFNAEIISREPSSRDQWLQQHQQDAITDPSDDNADLCTFDDDD